MAKGRYQKSFSYLHLPMFILLIQTLRMLFDFSKCIVFKWALPYVCVCVWKKNYIYICIHTYTYIYINTHTYIQYITLCHMPICTASLPPHTPYTAQQFSYVIPYLVLPSSFIPTEKEKNFKTTFFPENTDRSLWVISQYTHVRNMYQI